MLREGPLSTGGGFPLEPVFSEYVARVRDTSQQAKFFKILRIEMKNYSHPHDNWNVLN
jgi:hypothetical protein